ncbi:hypothetical protein SBRCBS47491_008016 [Sporothrix bragantina]|uniref:Major facilitator superfamily (MFS) profile domain-containing protein n=1 Tax=Sporothrix bragantina TaxID=671064 RepID=A0ABP0CKG5_9PEZI
MSGMNKDESTEVEYGDRTSVDQKTNVVATNGYVPDTDEEKRLVRKIDLYLLPSIWLMYLLSYMDRTNIGNAKIAGMATDLDLDSNRYSIALIVFFVSYVVFEIPLNMILAKSRPSIMLPTIMFLWGCLTIGMAWVPNYQGLVGFRFAIGIFEAGFAPGVLMLLSSWYKRAEQSKRFAVYISAAILSGAFGGLLGGAITSGLDGAHGIAGWRWLFIVEGAATAGWSVIAMFILPDFPATTRWLSERERELAVLRLQHDHATRTEDNSGLGHWDAIKQCLCTWRVWLFVVGYMAIVGSSTLSYFYPTLVAGLGYTAHMAQYMTIPIYAAAFVCNAVTGFFSDRNPRSRAIVLVSWMGVAMVCSIIICAVYNIKGRYALLVVMASALWSANGLALSYASSSFSYMPVEVKAIALALVNAMGNLAQIYGAYLFPSQDAPKYLMGFGVISGLCLTGLAAYLVLHYVMRRHLTTQH